MGDTLSRWEGGKGGGREGKEIGLLVWSEALLVRDLKSIQTDISNAIELHGQEFVVIEIAVIIGQ